MPLLYARDLAKTYVNDGVETPALRGVDFSVEPGEFVAIMGPSGSGKSTLLHMLGFLDRHTSGEYRFDGKTIDDYGQKELARVRNRKMGFVFQAFNLLARETVYANVLLPLTYSDISEHEWDARVISAVEKVGLANRVSHEAGRLSGGEKQRVAIARALVCDPQVVFADEPTGNLDSASGRMVMETIQRLNEEEGRTVLLITHETYTAEHARRIITIQDGRIESDRVVTHRHGRGDFKK